MLYAARLRFGRALTRHGVSRSGRRRPISASNRSPRSAFFFRKLLVTIESRASWCRSGTRPDIRRPGQCRSRASLNEAPGLLLVGIAARSKRGRGQPPKRSSRFGPSTIALSMSSRRSPASTRGVRYLPYRRSRCQAHRPGHEVITAEHARDDFLEVTSAAFAMAASRHGRCAVRRTRCIEHHGKAAALHHLVWSRSSSTVKRPAHWLRRGTAAEALHSA